jgi:hypothetical protein
MQQQKFTVQVTTLPDCDDITRFDGTYGTGTVAYGTGTCIGNLGYLLLGV